MNHFKSVDPKQLFGDYMKVTGVPSIGPVTKGEEGLIGKKLGVVNGSSWVSLWSTYFGKEILPGVKVINVGNEAVQLNFMEAHHRGENCPPKINIDLFSSYAADLFHLQRVDAVLISCSTMNRAFRQVSEKMKEFKVPVVQIDEAMMEEAVNTNGRILVIATHGPTVQSTQDLLKETANRLNKKVDFVGATVEEAFDKLGAGDIEGHNKIIERAIKENLERERVDVVVLAQLSMSVFSFSHPDPIKDFGIPVLNSGETGFRRVGEILRAQSISE